jgi:hypothetical protein
MKKLSSLVYLIFATLIVSCSSSENPTPQTNPTIIGKWKFISKIDLLFSSFPCNPEFEKLEFKINGELIRDYSNNLGGTPISCVQSNAIDLYTLNGVDIIDRPSYNGVPDYTNESYFKVIELTQNSLKLALIKVKNNGTVSIYGQNDIITTYERIN